MEGVTIVRYTDDFREQSLDLLSLLWSHLSGREQSMLFDWRYRDKPGQSDPPIYLATMGKAVVGFKAFVEHPFLLGSKEVVRTFTPADAIVHPAFRRRGISRALSLALLDEGERRSGGEALVFNLSSNTESTKANLELGWQATNGRKGFVLLASLPNYMRRLARKDPGMALRHRQGEAGGLKWESCPRPKAREMAQLAEKSRKPGRLTGLRDADYFRWRYSFQPDLYTFAYAYAGDEMLSYLVIRKVSDTQYLLWEYASAEAGSLKRLLRWYIMVHEIPFLRSWALSEADNAFLRNCGFFTPPARLWRLLGKEGLPVLVRPLGAQPPEKAFFLGGRDIRDLRHWQLFLADRH